MSAIPDMIGFAVMTVSDSRDAKTDKTGPWLREQIAAEGHAVIDHAIVTDDIGAIQNRLQAWIADPAIHAVIATGGTGLTGRDVTPEAFKPLYDKEMDGLQGCLEPYSQGRIRPHPPAVQSGRPPASPDGALTMSAKLTHQDDDGRIRMVDVGGKDETTRRAVATGRITMSQTAYQAIRDGQGPKGDALKTAELAGIMAAKKTSDLIPLCHPLPITQAKIAISASDEISGFMIRAEVSTRGRTGVEMEALTAVSVTALTIYDMAKALDKSMRISDIVLEEKTGGKSGDYRRDD